jgi:uncharacterized protein YaiE (UPF0345 family)
MALTPSEKDPEEEEGTGEPEDEGGEKEEVAPPAAVASPAMTVTVGDKTEVKVVVHMIGNSASIGVQQKGTDPVFSTATGTREEIMTAALKSLVDAEVKWKTAAKNPKANLPQPAATTAPTKAGTGTASKTAPPKAQPGFF